MTDQRNMIEEYSGKNQEHMERITDAERNRQLLREELERQRRAELMERLHESYSIDAHGGWHNKRNNDLVFSATDKKISTDRSDDQTVQTMLDLAEAKGWQGIHVKGDADFRRAIWMEANLRGIEVEGYKPRETDIHELEAKRRLRSHNALEASATSRERQLPPENVGNPQAEYRKEAAKGKPTASKEEILNGRLVDFGTANYNFNPMGKSSYYVRIDTPTGEKVVWGSQFRQAIEESKAKRGDRILLDGIGHKSIEIKERAHTPSEQALESFANQLINKHVKDLGKREQYIQGIRAEMQLRREQGAIPQVRVFDPSAIAKVDREVASPVVKKHSERTR